MALAQSRFQRLMPQEDGDKPCLNAGHLTRLGRLRGMGRDFAVSDGTSVVLESDGTDECSQAVSLGDLGLLFSVQSREYSDRELAEWAQVTEALAPRAGSFVLNAVLDPTSRAYYYARPTGTDDRPSWEVQRVDHGVSQVELVLNDGVPQEVAMIQDGLLTVLPPHLFVQYLHQSRGLHRDMPRREVEPRSTLVRGPQGFISVVSGNTLKVYNADLDFQGEHDIGPDRLVMTTINDHGSVVPGRVTTLVRQGQGMRCQPGLPVEQVFNGDENLIKIYGGVAAAAK